MHKWISNAKLFIVDIEQVINALVRDGLEYGIDLQFTLLLKV